MRLSLSGNASEKNRFVSIYFKDPIWPVSASLCAPDIDWAARKKDIVDFTLVRRAAVQGIGRLYFICCLALPQCESQ